MPNTYIKLLLSLSVVFSMASCESVVELPMDDVAKLAIRSDLSQDGLVAVVYLSKLVTDNQPIDYIENATVKVYNGDQFLEQLTVVLPNTTDPSNTKPYYKTVHFKPDFDVEYKLVVEVENFKPISSTTSVPRPVSLEDVRFSPEVSTGKNDEIVVNFEISLSLKDPLDIENYYHLKFYQELID
nr:DUF4249 domain-containing protein [Saprospiraceae bacterium]